MLWMLHCPRLNRSLCYSTICQRRKNPAISVILIPASKILLTPPLCLSNLDNLIQWIEFSAYTEINRNTALILVNVKYFKLVLNRRINFCEVTVSLGINVIYLSFKFNEVIVNLCQEGT